MIAPDEQQTLAALEGEFAARYVARLAGARAAVLGRLWGALAREPLDGVAARTVDGDTLRVVLDDGRVLRGSAAAAAPFAAPPAEVRLDGVGYRHPARLMAALRLPGALERFVAELDNSVANLALARAAVRPPAMGDLVAAEQSIVDGHPLHPACRARIGMSTDDVLRFAPEHHPTVRLRVVEVDAARWFVSGEPRPPLLPVHPWQLDRVLASGLGRDTGREIPAAPLMSLRTLAPLGQPAVHLKTAVNVQMTSAVRTLSPAAVRNGPLVSRLLADLAVAGLTVLRETSAAAVLVDGEPDRSMAAVWREAPAPGTVLPLAALAEFPALLTPPFLDALVDLLLPPLLTLLGLGVALEAHGQNTLVRLRGDPDGGTDRAGDRLRGQIPVEVLYRDMGGVRIHVGRLAAAGRVMPPLIGALPTDDDTELRTTLRAALFGTVLPQLVAAAPELDADAFWRRVAARVREWAPAADRDALLTDPVPVKATTAMRLAAEPLDEIWALLPNPLS